MEKDRRCDYPKVINRHRKAYICTQWLKHEGAYEQR